MLRKNRFTVCSRLWHSDHHKWLDITSLKVVLVINISFPIVPPHMAISFPPQFALITWEFLPIFHLNICHHTHITKQMSFLLFPCKDTAPLNAERPILFSFSLTSVLSPMSTFPSDMKTTWMFPLAWKIAFLRSMASLASLSRESWRPGWVETQECRNANELRLKTDRFDRLTKNRSGCSCNCLIFPV